MKKISVLDRILLFLTAFISGYYVVNGLEKYQGIVTLYFTIAFGILITTVIFLILFGFEILNEPIVVVVATFIPSSLRLTKPILAQNRINSLIPKLLFLASLGFVIGLSLE